MWFASLILLAVALSGAAVFEWFGDRLKPHLPLILAFGGAYLIGMIFTHLVPETYALDAHAGWFVLLGFLFQGFLEYLSQGIEHGHVHEHEAKSPHIPWAIVISLCLHAFIESMPLTEATGHAGHDHAGHVHLVDLATLNHALLMGLILHKFPVALVLMGMLRALQVEKLMRWFLIGLFGAMPLAGMACYEWLAHSSGTWTTMLPVVTGGVLIGILLHISTTILFETGDGHRFNLSKLAVTLAGLGLSWLASFI